MKPGLRTLLRRLATSSKSSATTDVVPSQPSTTNHHPPPRVQPHVPPTWSFRGRDRFTTEELIRHTLERNRRSIPRKEIEPGPEYPDVSRYAGDWGPSDPHLSWNGHAARRCDKWRHEIETSIDAETAEDMVRAERMERRVVKGLEPEFTRAVDKEEFADRMFVQLGWQEGVGPTLPPADLFKPRRASSIPDDVVDVEDRKLRRERPITKWPSFFLPPSAVEEPSESDERISSLHDNGHQQQDQKPPHLPHSKHHDAIKRQAQATVRERHNGQGIEEAFDLRQLAQSMPYPDPFEDNTHPKLNFSSSSVYSRPTVSSLPPRRRASPELFMGIEPEPLGPSLMVPFSWPQMPPSSSTQQRIPQLPLSERSFLSISKDMPVHAASRNPIKRAATAPTQGRSRRADAESEGYEVLQKMPTVAVGVERDKPTLREQRKARRERELREEAERAALKKRRGVGGWLSKFR